MACSRKFNLFCLSKTLAKEFLTLTSVVSEVVFFGAVMRQSLTAGADSQELLNRRFLSSRIRLRARQGRLMYLSIPTTHGSQGVPGWWEENPYPRPPAHPHSSVLPTPPGRSPRASFLGRWWHAATSDRTRKGKGEPGERTPRRKDSHSSSLPEGRLKSSSRVGD